MPHLEPSLNSAGVSLPRGVQAVRAAIELATRQRISQASIQLSPASLGGLRIQLRQTSQGLVARIVAEHPDAAQTLAQGGEDLRRSLQQAGIPVARLDIETSDRPGTQGAGSQSGSGDSRQHRDGGGPAADALEDLAAEPGAAATPTDGLVIVLA